MEPLMLGLAAVAALFTGLTINERRCAAGDMSKQGAGLAFARAGLELLSHLQQHRGMPAGWLPGVVA